MRVTYCVEIDVTELKVLGVRPVDDLVDGATVGAVLLPLFGIEAADWRAAIGEGDDKIKHEGAYAWVRNTMAQTAAGTWRASRVLASGVLKSALWRLDKIFEVKDATAVRHLDEMTRNTKAWIGLPTGDISDLVDATASAARMILDVIPASDVTAMEEATRAIKRLTGFARAIGVGRAPGLAVRGTCTPFSTWEDRSRQMAGALRLSLIEQERLERDRKVVVKEAG